MAEPTVISFLDGALFAPILTAAASCSAWRFVAAVMETRRPCTMTLTRQLPEGSCTAFGIFMV